MDRMQNTIPQNRMSGDTTVGYFFIKRDKYNQLWFKDLTFPCEQITHIWKEVLAQRNLIIKTQNASVLNLQTTQKVII